MMKADVRWESAPAFHEFASALKIETDRILLVFDPDKAGQAFAVFYTDGSETAEIYLVVVARDKDGILTKQGEPVHQPGMWERIEAGLKEAFEDDD